MAGYVSISFQVVDLENMVFAVWLGFVKVQQPWCSVCRKGSMVDVDGDWATRAGRGKRLCYYNTPVDDCRGGLDSLALFQKKICKGKTRPVEKARFVWLTVDG